jgi:UDP-N-acetyl-2-amino-2-deoxyglucuronate dehydrogenase
MYQFALIGCGNAGRKHADSILRTGKLIAVCDIDILKAESFAKDYNCRSYTSIDDLLKAEENLEVVSVATPNGLHAEHSIKALQARKHVVCENPLCITTAAAWQTIETEKFCRKKLFMVKTSKTGKLFHTIKDLTERDLLGTVYSFDLSCLLNNEHADPVNWRNKIFPGGGILYTRFHEYLDVIVRMFGEILSAQGFITNVAHKDVIELEDMGVSSLLMKNGITGSFQWSVNNHQKTNNISFRIISDRATIQIGGENLDQLQLLETDDEVIRQALTTIPVESEHRDLSALHYDQTYQLLVSALDKSPGELPNLFDGLKTVDAIEKIYKAVLPVHGE